MERRKKRWLAVLAGGLGALLVAELAARALGLGDELLRPRRRLEAMLERFPHLATEGPEPWELDETLGLRPRLDGREYGPHGALRNAHPAERPPGVARWLFVGDSVTRRERIVRALWRQGKELHPAWHDTEWWNAGVESYGLTQIVTYFERYPLALEPDVVVLTLHNNDLLSTPIVFRDGDGELVVYAHAAGEMRPWQPLLERSALYRAWVDVRLRAGGRSDRPREEARASFERLLALGAEHGFELRVLLQPRLQAADDWNEQHRESHAFFRDLLASSGVSWWDLTEPLEIALAKGLELHERPGDVHHPSDALAAEFARHVLANGFR